MDCVTHKNISPSVTSVIALWCKVVIVYWCNFICLSITILWDLNETGLLKFPAPNGSMETPAIVYGSHRGSFFSLKNRGSIGSKHFGFVVLPGYTFWEGNESLWLL